ncbi:hypothetical protein [Amycolatopsis japonica]|nr:hypothetical protein [Amycolatopsis japonica]
MSLFAALVKGLVMFMFWMCVAAIAVPVFVVWAVFAIPVYVVKAIRGGTA